MNVGFTGTSTPPGLTEAQRDELADFLRDYAAQGWLLNGLCVEADEQAAEIARDWGFKIAGYPGRPLGDAKRADVRCEELHAVPRSATPELDRNRNIVRDCGLLIACPGTFKRKLRSGTWATVRAAEKTGKPVIIIWPDGRVETTLRA